MLLAASLLFWGFYDRHEVVGPALLESPSIADAWRVRGDCVETNGQFVLTVSESGKMAGLNFRLPGAMAYDLVRVSGRVETDDVVEGKFSWRCARLLLIQYDQNDKWLPGEHGVISESGTLDWSAHEDVFEVTRAATHADLVVQNAGVSGVARFDELLAEPVRVRSSFAWWRLFTAALWVGMAALYFNRCRLNTRRLKHLIALNAAAILVGVLAPSEWISQPAEWLKKEFAEWVKTDVPAKPSAQPSEKPAAKPAPKPASVAKANHERIDQFNLVVGNAHKLGHFALFGSLCFLVYCSAALERQHPSYYFKVMFDMLLFAAVTESLQHLTLDRTPGFGDFITDARGMLLAFVVFLFARLLLFGWKRQRTR